MSPESPFVRLPEAGLRELYTRMLAHFGPLDWWPGDTRFEIMVGAVLTQNTAWTNVERAIANLRNAECLNADAMRATEPETLAELIRPAGYFNVKQRRLRNLIDWVHAQGGETALTDWETHDLRNGLLSVNGVGPETADDIVLYAFDRPVFVIDAYTRRLFSRFGWIEGDESYDALRLGMEHTLGPDVALFNEYHAQIVYLGKDFCRSKPRCDGCPVNEICPHPESNRGRDAE
ncbi:MAG: endonuclease [Gammaproteobacteria bacterium]|nr:endonuclease [Gammaproteobacteria bacterium]MCP5137116.1 endonuclease [Gammaproteobacteria bacterium]